MQFTLEKARAIVDKAVEYGAWNDLPADVLDETIMEVAETVIDSAVQADANRSVNDAVLELLFAASIEPTSEPTREAYARRFNVTLAPAASNGNAGQPAAVTDQSSHDVPGAPAQASAFDRAAEPPTEPQSSAFSKPADSPEQATGEGDISDIFPNYDDRKVAEIRKAVLDSAASGDLSPEEWERIKAYEVAHEDRKTIRELQPEFKAPEPEPQQVTITPAPDGSSTTVTWGAQESPVAFTATGAGAPPSDDDVSLEQVYAGHVPSLAQQEGLPIPHDADFSGAPNLPIDITGITDEQLSQLGTKFHSYFARGQWLLSQEDGRVTMAEHLEREAERDAFVRAYELHKQQIPDEKRSQPTALEAARKQAEKDAELADPVRTWRNRRVNHSVQARELKALCTVWDKAVWRVDKELDRRARLATTGRAAQ
jgi:hypothetical protein